MKAILKPESEAPSKEELRGKIMQLEAVLLSQPENLIQFELKHYFAPGIYMRQITIPKGVVLTGKIHKTEHMCVLSKGDVTVHTENGMQRIQASHVVHSMPGMKRAIYAHEESVWINVHHNPTNEHDLEKIEKIYVVDTFEQFSAFIENKQIEGEK